MANSIEDKIIKAIASAEELYYSLVLVVGQCGSGKTHILRRVAESYSAKPININLRLSEAMLELTEKQRQLKLPEILEQAVDVDEKIFFLDNTEILFTATLKQDPLRLLQGLSRNKTVVASWNGSFENNKLFYAEPNHCEYQSYNAPDALIININDETH